MPDPAEGLEPDVTVIEDEDARKAEQLKYYGGDELEDDDDLGDLDRGDNLGDKPPENEDRGDDVSTEEEEPEDDAEDEADATEDEAEETDDDDDDDDEAEDEDADDGDQEGDDDDEAEDDADESESDDDEPDDSEERDPGIPRHRFNEINERRKQAEQRVAELEAQQTAKQEAAAEKFDFDAAEEEYMELLLDGKTKEAGAKRREIRSAEQEIFKTETKQEALSDVSHQAELNDLNELSLQAEEMYPVFDESSADYDPVISSRVVTYMKGYIADGQNASDAFVSGLADVIEQYGLNGTDDVATESQDTKPQKTVTKKKPIKKTKEKIAAAKQQGRTPAGQGEGSAERGVAAPSIEEMSDDDLDKLDSKQLAIMRGDFVE